MKSLFMPGCALSALSPSLSVQTACYLKAHIPSLGFVSTCCARPTELIGQSALFTKRLNLLAGEIRQSKAEEVIVACPNCYRTLAALEEVSVVSLWEVLARIGLPLEACGKAAGSTIQCAVHDACATRDEQNIHQSVRSLLKALGYELHLCDHEGKDTLCCGNGGMVQVANPTLASRYTHACLERFGSASPVVYCASCAEAFASEGRASWHLLELIWGEAVMDESALPVYAPTHAVKKWLNRWKTKSLLSKLSARGAI